MLRSRRRRKGRAPERRRRPAGPRLPDQDRRGVAGQPRPRLGRRRPHRPRPPGRPRPGCAARRVDLRLPRGPDQQRRRVHGGGPVPCPRRRARGPRGPPPPRLAPHRRAAQRPLAGQGRQAQVAPCRGADDPRWLRALVGGPCPPGGELRRRCPLQRGDRPRPGRRARLGRAQAGGLSVCEGGGSSVGQRCRRPPRPGSTRLSRSARRSDGRAPRRLRSSTARGKSELRSAG
jgi:hypothetical protein